MKLCLINPKREITRETIQKLPELKQYYEIINSNYDVASVSFLKGISPTLATLASYLPPDIELDIIDERFQEIDFSKQYDLVAVSMMTPEAVRGYEIADTFRETGTSVVIGGVHATALPDEASKHCDSVIVGEGEQVWPVLLKDFQNGAMKPSYMSETHVDMQKIHLPRYDLLPDNPYSMVWLETSRGCPHNCEFCVVTEVHGKKIRQKNIDHIYNEILAAKEHFGNIHIGFTDDNLLAEQSRKRARTLLEKLIPLNIRWYGFTDISMAEDEEMLDLVKESGCVALVVGFESVNQQCLEDIDQRNWKHRKYEVYPQYIETIQSRGIGVIGSFMMGLDDEGDDIFDKTRDFIINNCLYGFLIGVVTPFPGTRLRERYAQNNRILTTGWDNYNKSGVNIVPQNMSLAEFGDRLAEMLQSLYTPEVLKRTMLHFKNIAINNLRAQQ